MFLLMFFSTVQHIREFYTGEILSGQKLALFLRAFLQALCRDHTFRAFHRIRRKSSTVLVFVYR